jgi:hypothetical protein
MKNFNKIVTLCFIVILILVLIIIKLQKTEYYRYRLVDYSPTLYNYFNDSFNNKVNVCEVWKTKESNINTNTSTAVFKIKDKNGIKHLINLNKNGTLYKNFTNECPVIMKKDEILNKFESINDDEKFKMCDEWNNKINWNSDQDINTKLSNECPVILKKDKILNKFESINDDEKFKMCDEWNDKINWNGDQDINTKLSNECPYVLNKQMLEELKNNVLQPFNCSFDYNKKGELNYYNSTVNCYSGPTHSYSRGYFGGWTDPLNIGCDTRDKLLYSSAENKDTLVYKIKKNKETCTPEKGEWKTYFDNKTATFDDSSDLEIDHTVPLKNAWLMGAYKWKPWQLETYANDMTPGHLEVMEGNANSSKSSESIDQWNPRDHYEKKKSIIVNDDVNCIYAANYAAVKHRWNLNLTDKEYKKLNDILLNNKCKTIKPKSKVYFEKNHPNLGLGISLQQSLQYPEKLQIYGLNDPNFDKLQQLRNKNNKDILYKYCNNSGSEPNKNKILTDEIKNNFNIFDIKNQYYFDKKYTNNINGQKEYINNIFNKTKKCGLIYY